MDRVLSVPVPYGGVGAVARYVDLASHLEGLGGVDDSSDPAIGG